MALVPAHDTPAQVAAAPDEPVPQPATGLATRRLGVRLLAAVLTGLWTGLATAILVAA